MKFLYRRLPTDDITGRFGSIGLSICSCCRTPKAKTINHIFLESDCALAAWNILGNRFWSFIFWDLGQALFNKNKIWDYYF